MTGIKDIKERASSKYYVTEEECYNGRARYRLREQHAYIQGATDQQRIDIEKAWSHFKDIIKDYCLETGQEYEDLSMWYNEFRQAMEE